MPGFKAPHSLDGTPLPGRRGNLIPAENSSRGRPHNFGSLLMFAVIDKIMNLDIGNRGIAHLYEPARARSGGEALCKSAAEVFMKLQPGDTVFLLTGSLTRAWVSPEIGENDGPMGTGALAGALSRAFKCVPMIFTDEFLQKKTGAIAQMAGPNVVTYEQASVAAGNPRYTCVTVMGTCAAEDALARRQCEEMVERYRPKAVISIERAGQRADGTYRNMIGQDFSQGRSRLDYMISAAQTRGIPTIGVGDGGNEIGMGALAGEVAAHIHLGDQICPASSTDILLPCGVSNWGCYAVQAALAILTGNIALAHTPELEERMIHASTYIGLVDGTTGTLEAKVDGMPADVHKGIVELMYNTVERALKKKK